MVENLAGEEWRPVVGYESYYAVSNLGRVKSLERTVWFKWRRAGLKPYQQRARIRKAHVHKKYFQMSFTVAKEVKTLIVHRLVAEAFLSNPKGFPEVDHKNGNTLDNRVENLDWVTRDENIRRAVGMGLSFEKGSLVRQPTFFPMMA